jgi:hypothetical protein
VASGLLYSSAVDRHGSAPGAVLMLGDRCLDLILRPLLSWHRLHSAHLLGWRTAYNGQRGSIHLVLPTKPGLNRKRQKHGPAVQMDHCSTKSPAEPLGKEHLCIPRGSTILPTFAKTPPKSDIQLQSLPDKSFTPFVGWWHPRVAQTCLKVGPSLT